MTTTAQTAEDIPRITHDDAGEVADLASAQLLDLLERLEPAHWDAQTECDRWDVAAMVGHIIGAAKGNASKRELVRQQVWGRRHASEHDGNYLDALNELQVADHADLTPEERIAELRRVTPPSNHARTHEAWLIRRMPLPLGLDSGSAMAGLPRTIRLQQLLEVVYTRDVWLHTVDIERATGVEADRSGPVDRRVVHDAVADWLQAHGQPVVLHLTGTAPGSFRQGADGPEMTLDAVEWARTVSGRRAGKGLLAHPVLF